MIFLDEIKDMKIYKKPFFAPINVDNKKKDSLLYLLTPNIESSKKLMTYPNMINRSYYQSYYLEKNVNYFINSSLLESADHNDEYLREADSESLNYLDYNSITEALSSKERNDLPDSAFGLPNKRKYPIHDKKHLKSAIRFFNYVDKEDEKELANNIIKQAKKLDVEISVGKNNRLKKYLTESSMIEESEVIDTEREIVQEGFIDFIKGKNEIYRHINDVIKTLSPMERSYLDGILIDNKNFYSYYDGIKDGFKTVAFIIAFKIDYYGRNRLNIAIGVNPKYRGRGYAQQLTSRLIEYAKKEEDIDMLFWMANAKNYKSIALAKKMNFELVFDSSYKKNFCYVIHPEKQLLVPKAKSEYDVIKYMKKNFKMERKYNLNQKVKDSRKTLQSCKGTPLDCAKMFQDILYCMGCRTATFIMVLYKEYSAFSNKKEYQLVDIRPVCLLKYSDKLYSILDPELLNKVNQDVSELTLKNDAKISDLCNFLIDKYFNSGLFGNDDNLRCYFCFDNKPLKDNCSCSEIIDKNRVLETIGGTKLIESAIDDDCIEGITIRNNNYLNEGSINVENKPCVYYTGYKLDVEDFRNNLGKEFENEINSGGKFHFIIKDNDLESCRIWIDEDEIINVELPSKKFYNKYYGDDYTTFIKYNILCAKLIDLNPISANTCLPYATASYMSGIYKDGDTFDKSTWSIEYLLSCIDKDYGMKEIINLVKDADIKKLYDYSRKYNINIGSIEELRYDDNINEVSKERRFNLQYFTRHIKYIGKKGKYKAHKIELDIKKNIEKNKPDAPSLPSAPTSSSAPSSPAPAPAEEPASESFSESILNNVNKSLYIKSDNMIMFTEDAKFDPYLRKILFNDRLRQNRDVLLKYAKIKEELDIIKYTFIDVKRYINKNLFVDLSYYNEVFFKNNQFKLDRGINLYAELLYRLFNTKVFDSYTKKTVFIPINDWDLDGATRMWFYRESINPISAIYRIMETTPAKLKEIFKDMDVIFLSNNRYFKLNFSNDYDYNKLKLKFKMFINKLRTGADVDIEDQDDTPDNIETKQAIVTNIVDKIETSTGVKLDQKALTGKPTDTSDSEKITTNKDTDDAVVNKKKEELLKAIDKTADTATNTDDALDKMDDERIKKLLIDLATQEEDAVKINNARASRMLKLQNDMLDIKIKNMTVKQILDNANKDEPLPETDIPVSINQDLWKGMKFINFGNDYDINEDIVKILNKLSKVSRPISIRNIQVEDNSTSEDYVDLYTIDMEDYRGKRFKIKFDVPKFKSNSDYLILRGNKKTIQNQFFNMPIIKTEDSTCQIITNYNKIFVRRFGTVAGKSMIDAGKIIKAINKYKGNKTKIQLGNNTSVCKKYELPIDYIDISQIVNTIENDTYILYFNQDEMRELYKDKIDYTKGLPFGYDKTKKEIMYFEATGIPFSTYIVPYLVDGDPEFTELYDAAARSVKYTYSKCSIMSTEIPLVVVCAYSEGLSQVLKKANVQYTIKEKLERSDRQGLMDYIKFNDGYVVYQVDYNSSLLMNGLKDCDTESYSLSSIDSRSMYIDFLDNFGGRIKADGLDNAYDCMIDPITEEVLNHYGLPTDYVSVLLHANLLLADNKFIKHTDTSSRRLRKQELIAVKVYKALFNDAYVSYANQLKHNKNSAQYSVKQSAVIDKFMSDSTSSDLSVINCLNDIETKNAITFKGENGMNTDRAYSLDKRTYDDSMLNLLAMSTGFSGNVGITRQATLDMNIDGKRGYIKSINNNTDKLSSTKTLSATEALNPFGTTRDDPFRTAMTFIQTAKHAVRTKESDPLLVTNGSDEALPYMTSDIFAFKAKQDGTIIEITDDYMIVQYKDGTKDYVNLSKTIEKNSDGGFYVPMKLDKVEKLKVGSKFKAKDILAYDKLSFSNSLGENDNIAYNVGTLTKVAVVNTDEGFEDSTIITSNMSERMATDVIVCKDITLSKDTNVLSMISVGDPVQEGDTLLIISDAYDDETTNTLLKNLIDDEDEISELGRKRIKSSITGVVAGIKIYRTVEIEEMSESLQKIVKKYEKPIKDMKKKLDNNGILSSDLPATYVLPTTGKLKNAVDSVRIEVYLEVHDILSVGDKIVMDRANKGIIKDIIPSDQAPYTEFRPNEEVSVFAAVSSFNNRMVVSPLVIGSINKLLIELDRSIKDILEIPYDDSKV